MSVQLITTHVWSALTDAARRSKKPAYVAVAYWERPICFGCRREAGLS
jgi:hypothetical protein